MNYNHSNRTGRFSSKRIFYKVISYIFVAEGAVLSFMFFANPSTDVYTNSIHLSKAIAAQPKTLQTKIEELKNELVDDLGSKCESKDAPEPDSLIIFDSNKLPSLGYLQFQRKTVQHYIKKFEGRDITLKEATEIAMNHEQAKALAMRIIFEEDGGLKNNWTNCTRKLGLEQELIFIKKLEK